MKTLIVDEQLLIDYAGCDSLSSTSKRTSAILKTQVTVHLKQNIS